MGFSSSEELEVARHSLGQTLAEIDVKLAMADWNRQENRDIARGLASKLRQFESDIRPQVRLLE
ncbi:MAG: hypothetical protein A2599_00790 [Candidatus Staskawiczbacteria bacterium RIFOXYD1_FULL_39_28]|uniref:Uncharacterized protein n=1 Tax=Candidatus Staskawiczbacteria bacterium RIFOXYC1_FULL_38_18 TaxID=1802229 RepID=A0A1G2JAP6_9BACT|nr:MAG: hypothetical protein A2401_00525 [Candidatus Staskawiczbacteria bacterium RIFOXYC1_FULL_38_18]OGZ91649.1 MAG: hypothetical protein A2599_00790 [Candidatus Staskawiczbacteria bacterium RIFOXYD1_FULL_39_28]